MLLIWF